jgi:cellulose synthase/poly-beta-1,6-N-acetylglucosamine synthase-like glycosyltransferase
MSEFLVIGLAAAILLMLFKSRLNYILLPTLPIAAESQPPDLTIIIPARNKAHRIARAVASFSNLPVIVVDDASSDDTAVIARQAGALVVSAPALPNGQKGKPNAYGEGARHASTKWILFVDADTWFDPPFARSLVVYAESAHLPFVTVFLQQVCETLAEKVLLPYAFALCFTGVNTRAVNNPKSREALANGQCMLFERAVYESIGGHSAVAESVIEDVALARHAKRKGIPMRVIRAETLGHVRMYDSFAAIWRGFQKNSFRFLVINPWCGLQVILASILLTSWLPVLLFGLADYPSFSAAVLLTPTPVTILFLAPLLSLLPWYRSRNVFLVPFAIYVFSLIALNGILATLSGRAERAANSSPG